jgi:hypothetical protein
VKDWVKSTQDQSWLQRQHMISFMTGVPNLWLAANKYSDMKEILKKGVAYHQEKWADQTLKQVHGQFYWEEPLEIRPMMSYPSKKYPFELHLSATLGDLDRMFLRKDKIDFRFDFTFSRNYLNWLKRQRKEYMAQVDLDGVQSLEKRLEQDILIQLQKRENHLPFKNSVNKLAALLAQEFMSKVITEYQPSALGGKDQMSKIPVNLYLGLFALNYINLRSDLD